MKIKLTESKLKQIVAESVKNVLLEYSPETYMKAAQKFSDKYHAENDTEKRKNYSNRGAALKQHATNLYNKNGSGNCITQSSSGQLNYKSASGYDSYITADGKISIVGKGSNYDFTNMPNELRVKPEDAKNIASWCNNFINNDYAKQYLGTERFWTIK